MGYKLKPNKAVAKRFKVTAKGKLKRRHSLTSHLRSGRTPKKKRHLNRPAIVFEGLARNMRRLMGVTKTNPNRAARRAAAKAQAIADAKK
jgi:large subunit ribosomal protein L35